MFEDRTFYRMDNKRSNPRYIRKCKVRNAAKNTACNLVDILSGLVLAGIFFSAIFIVQSFY